MSSLSIYKIEQENLNCIWDNPRLCYDYDRKFFVTDVARDIYDTIRYLHESDVKVTVDSVVTYGNQRNNLISKENIEYIRSQEYDTKNSTFYITNLKKQYAKLSIQEAISKDLFKVVTSKNELDVDQVREFARFLDNNLDLVYGADEGLRSIREVGEVYRGALIDRKLGNHRSYGDASLDRVLKAGAAPGQMTSIVGDTGMGKSTFALNLFSKQINKMIPTLYISLEMDQISTMDRLISIRKRIPTSWLLDIGDDSVDSDYVMSVFEDEMRRLEAFNDRFYMVDKSGLTTGDVESLIQKAKQKMGVDYLICTIDLTTLLRDCGTKPTDIELCINRLADISKRQNVHIINIVQLRRPDVEGIHNIEQIEYLRPKTESNIKNSGAIAERSRTVLTIFRRKAYAKKLFPDDPETALMDDEFDVTVVKQSMGEAGTIIKYMYDGSMFRLDPFIDNDSVGKYGYSVEGNPEPTDSIQEDQGV